MSGQPQRLFVLPPIAPDLSFGVLRRTFDGVVNCTFEFVSSKLHPIAPAVGTVNDRHWMPTAARHEVLLPSGTPDVFASPWLLASTFEQQAVSDQSDLAVVIKITLPLLHPLHDGWEAARAFTREHLVIAHGLPAVVVLHAPHLTGMRDPNPPHVHIVALARQLTPVGFGAFCTIANDRGHPPLAAAWSTQRPF